MPEVKLQTPSVGISYLQAKFETGAYISSSDIRSIVNLGVCVFNGRRLLTRGMTDTRASYGKSTFSIR
jgi:hypothetical protein